MAQKRLGTQTIKLSSPPSIISAYSIVGPKEGEGTFKDYFVAVFRINLFLELFHQSII